MNRMALVNPCPESPIPWREGGGRREEGERERNYEDHQFSNVIFYDNIMYSPLCEQRTIESCNQDPFQLQFE